MTRPKECDYICLSFKDTFTLLCKFSDLPLSVTWNLPGRPFTALEGEEGHTVNAQLANGSVTVRIDAGMQYTSYACNVIYHNGSVLSSNIIVQEGTTIY